MNTNIGVNLNNERKMIMEVFVLTVRENDFDDTSCYTTEEKAINAIITDIKERNNFGDNDQTDEMIMEIIEEMESDMEEYGCWTDDEDVMYAIDKCELK